jgi:hypothetical protein
MSAALGAEEGFGPYMDTIEPISRGLRSVELGGTEYADDAFVIRGLLYVAAHAAEGGAIQEARRHARYLMEWPLPIAFEPATVAALARANLPPSMEKVTSDLDRNRAVSDIVALGVISDVLLRSGPTEARAELEWYKHSRDPSSDVLLALHQMIENSGHPETD